MYAKQTPNMYAKQIKNMYAKQKCIRKTTKNVYKNL